MTSHNDDAVERTIGQLVADATHDISSIMRSEVALAKAEVRADAQRTQQDRFIINIILSHRAPFAPAAPVNP